MVPKIESDFSNFWEDPKTQCRQCHCFKVVDSVCFCSQAGDEVPSCGHCTLFQPQNNS
ncbi:MAG TPA: hypothetical protein VMD74_00170 [Candidatus Methylomirabilis sp.]|nr:hypothetical protein [Candidatus Methylomirabilis sp.]